ncbi:MAG: hypothetical protein AAGC99_15080 [Pseudomonadota bacterium]
MDSPSIAISVSPTPAKGGKGVKDKASDDQAEAFSISLEVARDEADGDTETTSITIQGVVSEGNGEETGGDTETEFTIEIETVVFSGDELADNLSASTVLGGGAVSVTEDGAFGVTGSISGDQQVHLEVGETLTFELPPSEGEVVGGQVTITNLYSNGDTKEGALVFAYDADDKQLASYIAIGNETGSVTVDIEVPFARLDFKALDNDSIFLKDNSDFGVSDITAVFASMIEDLTEGASELIDDIVTTVGNDIPGLVDLGHFGKVQFEITRISTNQLSAISALSNVRLDQNPAEESDLGRRSYFGQDGQGSSDAWLDARRYLG